MHKQLLIRSLHYRSYFGHIKSDVFIEKNPDTQGEGKRERGDQEEVRNRT